MLQGLRDLLGPPRAWFEKQAKYEEERVLVSVREREKLLEGGIWR